MRIQEDTHSIRNGKFLKDVHPEPEGAIVIENRRVVPAMLPHMTLPPFHSKGLYAPPAAPP
ncbi:hypothetical protein M413DRAFT_448352 [Hebeloma cylindrosporum]|uniref:Uncharacterized protein n=1 Tax=Hebeloma cylindrosporum TaxID=76867 RepID=A0A0C2Y922_HEBCY|nr:hypothetical protein M413DRAFT_448352 [Hebeloma cylindrosporum h7]